ncbi:hypothetical protein D1AOALGA4SA_10835 [Olavius algarvensis Delta 1 endosymbiont]|nr:hypothetical protein D1AOALGA4SA_10835 [Olavius algarvensis Delta 1 endosymbiont]
MQPFTGSGFGAAAGQTNSRFNRKRNFLNEVAYQVNHEIH